MKTFHYIFDGYKLDNRYMREVESFTSFMNSIKNAYCPQGTMKIIPYFNGIHKEDGGLTGIILADDFHFTCHTFCFKNIVFIDCYSLHDNINSIPDDIKRTYDTPYYNDEFIDINHKECDDDNKWGKHCIAKVDGMIPIQDAKKLVADLLVGINMHPISELITYEKENSYALLQVLAESHISMHTDGLETYIDIFSCNNFDSNIVDDILSNNRSDIKTTEIIRKKQLV